MLTKSSLRMIIIYLSLISIAFGFISPDVVKSAGEINIKIWIDKVLYLSREPIFVNYEIKNVSDSFLLLCFSEIQEHFVIKDQDGRFHGPLTRGEYVHGDTLHPDQSHTAWLDITFSYRVTEPGEYECRIQMPSGGFFPYTGAKSNTVTIKIKNPTGNEKKALDLYLEAQKLHWCKDKDPKKWEQAFYKYLGLAEKYPNSVYAPISLYNALFKAHVIEDKNVAIRVCKKLIEDYPGFHYIDDVFYNLAGVYKVLEDKAGAMEYMEQLMRDYPDTKISERAEFWLEKIEKWEFE
jgi:hypothetical protein